ncbi:MAG: PaaI family thioesterase [Candidatus Helarchaeota archaeon]|nr:PaaI family thioesterase [Candidatus Helarchaeota archaeon]
MDPKKLKEYAQRDNYFEFMGIQVLDIREGKAKVSLKFENKFMNFFNAGHGGAIYSLADSAFQLACNASADIEIAVALSTNLNHIKKVEVGERLVADAEVIASTRKTSITEINIKNEKEELVAVFRGVAYLKRKKEAA